MPKKKVTRKAAKRYEFVEFEVPELFNGTFKLPKFQPPLGVLIATEDGHMSELVEWLREAKTDEEYIEEIKTLIPEEVRIFIDAWAHGQLANAPKSSD